MRCLLLDCELQKASEPELLSVTKDWLLNNSISDLDVFDEQGYWIWENNEKTLWINQSGTISIFDFEDFENCKSSNEREIAYLENEIKILEFYIMLCELERKSEMQSVGIISFRIDDESMHGYRKGIKYARLDLIKSKKNLSCLKK